MFACPWMYPQFTLLANRIMKYRELMLLLPCHSLEDFPLYHTGDEAEGLLAAWSALWHPALIHCVGQLPAWYRADESPEDLQGKLILIPQVSETLIAAGWTTRAKNEGAVVVRKKTKRADILAAALKELDDAPQNLDPEMVADCLALGFCQLQTELLIRRMRHYNNMDETHLQTQALAAVAAIVEGDSERAKGHLQQCFDLLAEARERCYPAEAYLLDLTLTAETTLGASLRQELQRGPVNVLIAGDLLPIMAEKEPETLAALKLAVEQQQATLVGGEMSEADLPLMPLEAVLRNFQRGRASYLQHLGQAPQVYGRRRFGLTPILPQILSRFGFEGALHFTLDDGQFPKSDQSKTAWEGTDVSTLPALARVPADANDAASFLNFPEKMGESMDLDFVALAAFAHWPGQYHVFYDDMRRMTRYAPALGRFYSLEKFFAESDASGRISKFTADEYRSPYLKQAVIRRKPDPASHYRAWHLRQAQLAAAEAMHTVAMLLQNSAPAAETQAKFAQLAQQIDDCGSPFSDVAPPADLDQQLTDTLHQTSAALSKLLPRQASGGGGCVVFNPLSFMRRACVEVAGMSGVPAVDGAVKAVQAVGEKTAVVVDVPAMGYVWIPAGGREASKSGASMVEDLTLKNEAMIAVIDPHTGGLRSLRTPKSRENRLSQQLSLRIPGARLKPGAAWRDPDEDAIYSVMAADSVEVTANGSAFGEITSKGRILTQEAQTLATFEQRVRVWRGTRVLDMDISLTPTELPRSDPWNSYYCARFAWNDSAADLFRGVGQLVVPTDGKRLESPYFIESRSENQRTTIFTGGLPFHRRQGMRMLDCLLIPRGETSTRFRLGIGVDVDHPQQAALNFITPSPYLCEAGPPPTAVPSSWFFHVDAKNMLATHWSPLLEDGRPVGYRVRLLETEGRTTRLRLRSFREPKSARQVDFLGRTLCELRTEGDGVSLDAGAYEWIDVEVRWA